MRAFSVSLAALKRWPGMRREGEDLSPRCSTGRRRRTLSTLGHKKASWRQLEENGDATTPGGHCELRERRTGGSGAGLRHEPGHTREAGLGLQGKALAATERDEEARSAFRRRLRGVDPKRPVFAEESSTSVALTPRYARAPKGERAHGKAPRNRGKNVAPVSSVTLGGMGPSMSIEGSSDTGPFGPYMGNVLAPRLGRGRIALPHGQPLRAQEQTGEGARRRERLPAVAPPRLPAGPQPRRGSLPRSEGPAQEGQRQNPAGAVRGYGGGASRGQRRRCPRLPRASRLRDAIGPPIMTTALGRICHSYQGPGSPPWAARVPQATRLRTKARRKPTVVTTPTTGPPSS